jgi:hypothetical protein
MKLLLTQSFANAPEMLKELILVLETYDKGTDTYKRIDDLIRKITD